MNLFQAFKKRSDHADAAGTGRGTLRIPENYSHVGRQRSSCNLTSGHRNETRRLKVHPERGHANLQGSVYARQTHNTILSQSSEEH